MSDHTLCKSTTVINFACPRHKVNPSLVRPLFCDIIGDVR